MTSEVYNFTPPLTRGCTDIASFSIRIVTEDNSADNTIDLTRRLHHFSQEENNRKILKIATDVSKSV